MKKIAFVCLGNICRSPMAEFVMKNLTTDYHIESRATSTWEHGNPIHRGTQNILEQYDIPYDATRGSTPISAQDFETFDLILGMDTQNVRDLIAMAPKQYRDKIHLFTDNSVPDPYYTGDFEETYQLVTQGCHQWINKLANPSS